MIYSKDRNFIFVHIYKTGGTSITESLIPHSIYPLKVWMNRIMRKTKYDRGVLQPCFKHATAAEIKKELGPCIFNNAFVFAFVRNPWDLQVSLYKYLLRWERGPHYKMILTMKNFSEYIKYQYSRGIRPQSDFLVDDSGDIIVDYIGRFETLENDFCEITKKIGIESHLPRINVSDRKPYPEYYSEETASLVRKAYASDIRLFNYDF